MWPIVTNGRNNPRLFLWQQFPSIDLHSQDPPTKSDSGMQHNSIGQLVSNRDFLPHALRVPKQSQLQSVSCLHTAKDEITITCLFFPQLSLFRNSSEYQSFTYIFIAGSERKSIHLNGILNESMKPRQMFLFYYIFQRVTLRIESRQDALRKLGMVAIITTIEILPNSQKFAVIIRVTIHSRYFHSYRTDK